MSVEALNQVINTRYVINCLLMETISKRSCNRKM